MSTESKNAITLVRATEFSYSTREKTRQYMRIRKFAEEHHFYIWQDFDYCVSDNDADGLASMMCYLLSYIRHNPEVKHILVANANVVCPSDSLYELFCNHLTSLGASIEAPEFYAEGEGL